MSNFTPPSSDNATRTKSEKSQNLPEATVSTITYVVAICFSLVIMAFLMISAVVTSGKKEFLFNELENGLLGCLLALLVGLMAHFIGGSAEIKLGKVKASAGMALFIIVFTTVVVIHKLNGADLAKIVSAWFK